MVKFNFTLSAVNGEKKTAKQIYGVVRRNAHVPYGDFAKFKDIVGVYYIKCKTTNKQYVGSTTNVAERIGKHFSELFNNKHTNKRSNDKISIISSKHKCKRSCRNSGTY